MTMLPSGMEVRIEQVPVAEMIATGFLPGQLRALAIRFATPEGVTPSELDAAERTRWDELMNLMISRSVVGVRWICECKDCLERRADPIVEQPYHLSPEALAADPPKMPRVDLVALRDIATFTRTPKQVDAISRVAHGQMDDVTAAAIVDGEQVNTLSGWASFRHLRRGLDAGADGQGLGPAAELVPAGNRATRRAAARRRPRGHAAAGESAPTQQPAGS
jgi:hypothetical protein